MSNARKVFPHSARGDAMTYNGVGLVVRDDDVVASVLS
jgi:hypothetical protein